jgi:CheY-like chemotaxis protein
VESQVGQGTVFRVYLPVLLGSIDGKAPPAPVAKPVPPAGQEKPKGRRGVLVVDDEPGVLSVTGRLLQTEGYQVFTSTNGADGLQILREKRADIDLVITDFSMPDMDGPTLAVELRRIAPTLKILGVSGLNHQHRMDELKAIGFCEVLNKPYEMDVLLQVVRQHMISSANGS